jgi:hypothetical protein
MKNGVFWDVTPCGSCKNPFYLSLATYDQTSGRELTMLNDLSDLPQYILVKNTGFMSRIAPFGNLRILKLKQI